MQMHFSRHHAWTQKKHFEFIYGINFKNKGMLSHFFDRIYVVMKFFLPTVQDLKFTTIKLDSKCSYLHVDMNENKFLTKHIPNIRNLCKNVVPFIYFCKEQIEYYNQTAHEILTKEISLILQIFLKERKEKEASFLH